MRRRARFDQSRPFSTCASAGPVCWSCRFQRPGRSVDKPNRLVKVLGRGRPAAALSKVRAMRRTGATGCPSGNALARKTAAVLPTARKASQATAASRAADSRCASSAFRPYLGRKARCEHHRGEHGANRARRGRNDCSPWSCRALAVGTVGPAPYAFGVLAWPSRRRGAAPAQLPGHGRREAPTLCTECRTSSSS